MSLNFEMAVSFSLAFLHIDHRHHLRTQMRMVTVSSCFTNSQNDDHFPLTLNSGDCLLDNADSFVLLNKEQW